ncbi:universal stress protein [Alkalihalobacillus deserti]|uniref:universal stress protein n=1 Tax=Alkalihalobacillus deserti TaxID=2879466 RepID=UPI001D136176|nr:universal stress protein [Alkalihalobacillus deserti]
MSLDYQTILVAVDGSAESELALQKAIKLATGDDVKLAIAYVIDNRTAASFEYYERTFAEETEKFGVDLLKQYQNAAIDTGLSDVETVLEHGSPKVKLPKDIATAFNVDLIIARATGINTVERILIGSVSENIARRAKCDVLIVRK